MRQEPPSGFSYVALCARVYCGLASKGELYGHISADDDVEAEKLHPGGSLVTRGCGLHWHVFLLDGTEGADRLEPLALMRLFALSTTMRRRHAESIRILIRRRCR